MASDTPRKVKFGDLFKGEGDVSDKVPAKIAEMFGTGWGTFAAFMQYLDPVYETVPTPGAPGDAVQYPIWPIDSEDEKTMGEATAKLLHGLPAKEKKQIAKFINRYAPIIGFGSALAKVFGPRAKFSYEQKKATKRNAQRAVANQTRAQTQSGNPAQSGGAEGASGTTPDGVPTRGPTFAHVADSFASV